jgi:lipoprotein signal peptidase
MEQITKYFNAEKAESIIFTGLGIIAIFISLYFLFKLKQPFTNGIAYPLIAIALIHISVGIGIFVRSPKDIIRVNEIVQKEPTRIQSEEIPRMKTVMKNFVLYRWIEIAFIIIGLLMYLYFAPETLLKGVGVGLMIQGGVSLLLDFFAEARGKEYLKFLDSL